MRSFTLALLLTLFAGFAFAQTQNQGALTGTVADTSGAMVAGAAVTATNVATAISSKIKTDQHGSYRFSFLAPGTYTVVATAEGFQKTELRSVIVNLGTITNADFKMKVGSSNETVDVTSAAPVVNTDNAERGDVLESTQIQHLPLNGREFLQLAALEPGAVNGNPKRGVHPNKGGVDVSFNGARGTTNSYYVNGAASNDPLYNTIASSPALDAVAEFRVLTNMYSAQYGRAGGAVISVLTKSGTNAFHGSAYEYHRNKALDALPYFFNKPRNTLPNHLFNQYGGTIGGPIIIPHIYNGKNKTFFFFSAEGFHYVEPAQLIVGFAPTTAERNGDVSNTINPFSGQPVALMNPYTGQPIPGNVLPDSLKTPIGKYLMSLWPTPNYSGDPFLNWRGFRGGTENQRKFMARIDHHISDKNMLTGTWDFNNYDNISPGYNQYADKDGVDHTTTWAGTFTHMFNPRLVNDTKVSFDSLLSGSTFALTAPGGNGNFCAKWGFDPTINTVPGTCRILLYTIGYQRYDIGNDGNYEHHDKTLYLKNNLVWVAGRHTFTFGGEWNRDMFNWQYDSGSTAYYFGVYEGLPGYNQYYGMTGSTFTDLLMGLPNLVNVGIGGTAGTPSNMNLLRNEWAGYVQDDWKVVPSLTLNLGVRYDYEQPFANTDNEFMTLDFNTGLPRFSAGAPANLLSLVRFKYETGGPNRPYNPNPTNFSPRFGFAWRPFHDDNSVLKGGYGIFYTTETAFTTMYGTWVAPFQGLVSMTPAYAASWPDGQQHIFTVDQPLPTVTYQGQQMSALAYKRGTSPGTFFPNTPYYPTGYVQQYNLTYGHTFGGVWGTEIAYVGSHSVNLNGPMTTQTYNPTLYAETVANGFSNFSLRTKGFNAHYDAMQVTLKRAPAKGFNLLATYTWSHALAQASNDDANENLVTDVNQQGLVVQKLWSNADFDVRHRISVAGGYELPFGKGQAYGSGWNPFVDGILGGWRANWIYTYQTGVPFTVYTSGLKLPDRTCSGILSGSARTATHWFDPTCFPSHVPVSYTDPNTGKTSLIDTQGNSRPNIIPGPPRNDVDFGMEKAIHITERNVLGFRAEAFNLFNHPNLIGPSGNYFFNSPSGAAITQARDGRDIQLSIRYSF